MSRIEPIKVIENPISGVSTDEDDLGEDISEARVPLLRHSVKRHSTPSTHHGSVDVTDRCLASSSQIIGGGGVGGGVINDPLLATSSTLVKAGISPSGSSNMTTSANLNSTSIAASTAAAAAAVNGKRAAAATAAGISQSQSLQVLGNPQNKTTGKQYIPGAPSVHSQKSPMGSVVVVSDKEGGKPTSGYLPADALLISDSSSPLPPVAAAQQQQHPRSNSQTGCFQDDGYCIAVLKNSEGTLVDTTIVKVSRVGNPKRNVIAETKLMMASSNVDDPGGGSFGDTPPGGTKKRASSSTAGVDGSRLDLHLSTSTLRPMEEDGGGDVDRETWSQGLDFLLSIIGFAVDLANVWRFPYFCYKNGGGAFLIPYFLMLALSAIPVFYMELLLGQSIRQGPISMWKICPLFKGVGYCAVTVSYFVSFYYNTIMCWSLHFTISSMTSPLPWTSCNNTWNTKQCYNSSSEDMGMDENGKLEYEFGLSNNTSMSLEPGGAEDGMTMSIGNRSQDTPKSERPANATSPASEYFRYSVLEMEGHNIDNLGSPKTDLLVCLAVIYCLLYVILFRGIRSTGKVVYVTALLPYLVMLILLIRGVMLEGAVDGIYYYLVPNMTKLWEIGVWSDAAKQIFFSSGAGFGVHLTYASYNNFHNNCYRDCIVTSCVNCFTSIFSGFVIFTFLGSMAHRQGRPIEEVVKIGPGLVFEVYPEAVGTLPGANFWSILFFIMLIMLGIDSAMGGLECVVTGITDEFKSFFKRKKHGRQCFMFLCVLISFLIGIINVTRGGMYTFTFLDNYAAGSSLLLSVLFEILAVSWVYGLDQLCKDAEAMLGFQPGLYWRICWKFVSPLLISTIIILDLCTAGELTHEDYRYPDWAQIFGYIFTFIPITLVPIVGFIEFMKYPGDCKTKLAYSITPVSEHAAIREGGRIRRMHSDHWSYFRWRK